MLLILLLQLVISLVTVLTGFIFYSLYGNTDRPLINYFLTGLVLLTTCSQVIQLFAPLNLIAQVSFLVILFIAACFVKQDLPILLKQIKAGFSSSHPLALAGLLISGTFLLIMASGPPISDDTEAYHMQILLWSKTYKAVPGIANLHIRYGFQSAWFSISALFLPPIRTLNFFSALNALSCTWFIAFLLHKILAAHKEPFYKYVSLSILIILSFCLYSWALVRGSSANSNYDMITTIILIVLVIQATGSTLTGSITFNEAEWFLWPCFIFAVRIINYPFLLLVLTSFIFLWKAKEYRKLIVISIVSFVLISAQIIRTYIAAGYPFFPSTAFAFMNPDWSVPRQDADELLSFIRLYNRVSTEFQGLELTRSMGSFSWIPAWFHYLFTIDKIIVLLTLVGIIKVALYLRAANKWDLKQPVFVLFMANFCNLISWLIVSPDPRFAYSSLLLFSSAALVPGKFLQRIKVPVFNRFIQTAVAGILFAVLVFAIRKPIVDANYRNFITPISIKKPPFKTMQINNTAFHIPGRIDRNWNARCFCLPLPCVYDSIPGLTLRGISIQDGFTIKKN